MGVHYLLVTDAVHATAAACDYLEGRIDPGDAVTVAAVAGSRDAGDAANVATARLAGRADVDTTRLAADDPASRVLDAAARRDVDAVLLDARLAVPPEGDRVSEAVTRIVGRASVPVVVLPRDA